MICQRMECQTTAGCAHRGPAGQMCYFPETTFHPTSTKPCPYCLGSGRVIVGSVSQGFAGLPEHLQPTGGKP